MSDLKSYTIGPNCKLKEVMEKINNSPSASTLFVIDDVSQKVVGTITDGDIRRGLLKGMTIEQTVSKVMKTSFRYLTKGNYYNDKLDEFSALKLKIVPLLDNEGKLLKVFDLTVLKSVLPIDVVFMAGGKGERLHPMTQNTPKPLLHVGTKPILEHNLDRLILNGVDNFYISVNYLGHMIKDHFKDGSSKNASIQYINEDKPMGTIGAVSKITDFKSENVLVMNSDLLTNIDYANFYKEFITQKADIAIAAIPYKVSIPYAVMETKDNIVSQLKEKPTYTYYSNAGIYLIKRSLLDNIPRETFFNATEFLEQAIERSNKVISYPMIEYWLDIGRPDDYVKAQEDIKHLNF